MDTNAFPPFISVYSTVTTPRVSLHTATQVTTVQTKTVHIITIFFILCRNVFFNWTEVQFMFGDKTSRIGNTLSASKTALEAVRSD